MFDPSALRRERAFAGLLPSGEVDPRSARRALERIV
jgi:hypothetical protein